MSTGDSPQTPQPIPPRPNHSPGSGYESYENVGWEPPPRPSRPLLGIGIAVGAVLLVGILIWVLVSSMQGGGSASEGKSEASAYAVGDCFADFDANASANRKVPCTDAHSAQLVGLGTAEGDEYPGREALEEKAAELCRTAPTQLPEDTSKLKQRTAYPTQDGWKNGDRRMDCFIEHSEGNQLTASLLK